jgi:hypothetical protein
LENSEDLLREVIRASNRTTRAVRAFVRFLFIQLTAITLAVLVFQLGSLTQDTSQCSFGVCPPSPGWTIFAGLIWVVGVIWSSRAGWMELEQSDPTKSDAEVDMSASRAFKASRSNSAPPSIAKCRSCSSDLQEGERICGSCGKDRLSNFAG